MEKYVEQRNAEKAEEHRYMHEKKEERKRLMEEEEQRQQELREPTDREREKGLLRRKMPKSVVTIKANGHAGPRTTRL